MKMEYCLVRLDELDAGEHLFHSICIVDLHDRMDGHYQHEDLICSLMLCELPVPSTWHFDVDGSLMKMDGDHGQVITHT